MKIFKQNFIYTLCADFFSAQGNHMMKEIGSKITPQSNNGDVVNVGSKSNATRIFRGCFRGSFRPSF